MKTFNYKEAANFLKIKPHKTGKHVLFFRKELEAWIKSLPVETLLFFASTFSLILQSSIARSG
jgi:hypothetical protein